MWWDQEIKLLEEEAWDTDGGERDVYPRLAYGEAENLVNTAEEGAEMRPDPVNKTWTTLTRPTMTSLGDTPSMGRNNRIPNGPAVELRHCRG